MGNKILIIDDNLASAEALVAVLDMVGHPAQIAHGAVAGLQAVASFKPSLVFLDLGMPVMNGYQVAARIRGDANVEQPYLIAYTAWDDQATIKLTRAAGFDRHIAKTTPFEVLVEAIRRVAALRLERVQTQSLKAVAQP